ncbi:hypothetical protein Zmor_026330 [Zophobas morio]|uniref:Uncharacterized protein n=1 Tax=Zophobas morio TaxID=2755281 RepID=A0AA38HTG1_9CUCU|nr:hypothetical protein Zmor_026330 [Zophobas morio]
MDDEADIRALQTDLLTLRQHFREYTNRKSKRQYKEKLERLDSLEYQFDDLTLPDFSVDDIKDFSQSEVEELKKKLKKHIKLLQILTQKANCPISRIIDNI